LLALDENDRRLPLNSPSPGHDYPSLPQTPHSDSLLTLTADDDDEPVNSSIGLAGSPHHLQVPMVATSGETPLAEQSGIWSQRIHKIRRENPSFCLISSYSSSPSALQPQNRTSQPPPQLTVVVADREVISGTTSLANEAPVLELFPNEVGWKRDESYDEDVRQQLFGNAKMGAGQAYADRSGCNGNDGPQMWKELGLINVDWDMGK
ncbi:hypothetical protein BDN72DRAFT_946505, partial [Pluteus cervinus]